MRLRNEFRANKAVRHSGAVPGVFFGLSIKICGSSAQIMIQLSCLISASILIVVEGSIMLKNRISKDIKIKCLEGDTTQEKLAEAVGTSAPYVSRLINNQEKIVNKTYIAMLENLGYDIELHYVKREG